MGYQSRLRVLTKRLKKEPPMKVVPSKKGLATVFTLCAILGYATGVLVHWIRQ